MTNKGRTASIFQKLDDALLDPYKRDWKPSVSVPKGYKQTLSQVMGTFDRDTRRYEGKAKAAAIL